MGNWVNHVKWSQLDKGKGQLELMTLELEDSQDNNLAQCQVDLHWLMELNKLIAHSFEALIVLLSDWLPALGSGGWETAGPEEEVEDEDDVEM